MLKAGARGYVLKSDADKRLVETIDSLRQHKPFFSPDVTELVLGRYVSQPDVAEDRTAAAHDFV